MPGRNHRSNADYTKSKRGRETSLPTSGSRPVEWCAYYGRGGSEAQLQGRSTVPPQPGVERRSVLAGLIYCRRCNGIMISHYAPASGQKTKCYYRDLTRLITSGCSQTAIPMAILDAAVVERIHAIQRSLPCDALTKLQSRLDSTDKHQTAHDTIMQFEEERKHLATMYRERFVPEAEYETADAELARQLDEARLRLDLSTERSLSQLLEAVTTFPCECDILHHDVEAMARLNGTLRSIITAIYVDRDPAARNTLTTRVEWSDRMWELCRLLDIDPDQPQAQPSEDAIEGTVAPSPTEGD